MPRRRLQVPRGGARLTWIAVAMAGAAGALTRYGLAVLVGPRSYPWTTLAINVTGAFMLTLLVAGPLATRRNSPLAVAITVGFLGAYTTFSAFGLETVEMVRDDRIGAAATYVAVTLILGLAGAAAGYWVGQRLGQL